MRTSLEAILATAPDEAAKRLLGSYLVRTIDESDIVCRIVETEAYDQNDPASHSYRGRTPRNSVMFGSSGFAYVYFTYGMHYCFNVVTGPKGYASAVLIRALQPLVGLELIRANRRDIAKEEDLTNGPGKLCQALSIGREFNGQDLTRRPLRLEIKPPLKSSEVVRATRIGITRAKDRKWRFYIKDNAYVSR